MTDRHFRRPRHVVLGYFPFTSIRQECPESGVALGQYPHQLVV